MLAANAALSLAREPVQDVGERLVVHLLVLEDVVGSLGADQTRIGWILERRVGVRVEDRRIRGAGEAVHGCAVGPGGALVLGRDRGIARIDSAVEQSLQLGVERGAPKRIPHQGDERKTGDVPVVEDERVAQRQRCVFVRFRCDHREKVRGPLPVGTITRRHRFTVDCCCSQRVHVPAFTRDCAQSRAGWALPYYRSRERRVAARLSTWVV